MRMAVSGRSSLMARVAASPSRSGMRMSISTRSGRSWRDSATASWPVAASPTTSRSGSGASMVRSPSRASSWSSAITTRARRDGCAVARAPRGGWSLGSIDAPRQAARGQRHLSDHPRAGARLAVHDTSPTQQPNALLHADQAQVLARSGGVLRAGRADAPTPVTDLQAHDILVLLERDSDASRPGVLPYVVQRLLRDPEQGSLGRRRQAPVAQSLVVRGLPALPAQGLHLEPNRRCEPEVVQGRRPQTGDHPARLAHRTLHQLHGAPERLAFARRVGSVVVGVGLEVLVRARRHLGQPIVDLVGDPAAFLLLRDLKPTDEVLEPLLPLCDLPPGGFRCQARVLLAEVTGAQVRDMALYVLGHLVEHACQDANLIAPGGVRTARQVATPERRRVRG